MALADGIRFMRWAAERFDDLEPASCLTHPSEEAPALRELLECAVPLLMVEAPDDGVAGLAPTVLVDLKDRPDLVDLPRVARLDSAGRMTREYTWHAVRCGFATFAVVHVRIRRPARAELAIAFPTGLDEVRHLLEVVAITGWLTIGSADDEFRLVQAAVDVGLADCLNAEAA